MRIFNNLIIIALIGLLSSTYLFNLSPIDYRGSIEIEPPEKISSLSLEINNTDNQLNPETIVINHITDKDEVVKIVTNNLFAVSVYENNNLVLESLNDLELVSPSSNMSISINEQNPMVTTLDISQETLGLEDGTYKIIFQSNLIIDPERSSVSLNVTYDSGGIYHPALNTAPVGTKGLTLYFTTDKADTLLPVTRFVVEDKSLTRMAIEQLQNGPSNTGMKTVIGDVTNTTYNNGNVVIDIPSTYTQYNNGSTGGLLTYEAFVKSIFEVDRYWPIHSVTFTVDRKVVSDYFHGIDTSTALPNTEKNYLVYLAYKLDDRMFLFDYQIDMQMSGINPDDSTEIKAKKLFDIYSNINLSYGRNPIPKNVDLQGVSVEGNTLILDFNDSILKSYKDNDDLKIMMVEALVYSFTTIQNIDSIRITVNNVPLTNFIKDKDLTGILYPPEFINPEVIQ